jgi:hypothetical protein
MWVCVIVIFWWLVLLRTHLFFLSLFVWWKREGLLACWWWIGDAFWIPRTLVILSPNLLGFFIMSALAACQTCDISLIWCDLSFLSIWHMSLLVMRLYFLNLSDWNQIPHFSLIPGLLHFILFFCRDQDIHRRTQWLFASLAWRHLKGWDSWPRDLKFLYIQGDDRTLDHWLREDEPQPLNHTPWVCCTLIRIRKVLTWMIQIKRSIFH